MSLSIQSSYASLVTEKSLSSANSKLQSAMEQLSTGYAVNSSADNAAGLSIATRMESQTNGITVAESNVTDATNMLSTADGALSSMTDIVSRMQDLATEAANDTYDSSDRDAMQSEYSELASQLGSVMKTTAYGGTTLLNTSGTAGLLASSAGVTFQVGASAGETLTVALASSLTAIYSAISALAAATSSLASATAASGALTALSTLQSDISSTRSTLGAKENRLTYISDNLTNEQENTQSSIDDIMDADYASQTSAMSKQQLLEEAGISVLGEVNTSQSLIKNLLS